MCEWDLIRMYKVQVQCIFFLAAAAAFSRYMALSMLLCCSLRRCSVQQCITSFACEPTQITFGSNIAQLFLSDAMIVFVCMHTDGASVLCDYDISKWLLHRNGNENSKWRNTVIFMFYVPWSVIIIRSDHFCCVHQRLHDAFMPAYAFLFFSFSTWNACISLFMYEYIMYAIRQPRGKVTSS